MVGLRGVQNSLEAGDYEFDPGTPVVVVVDRIAAGETASRDVVIPEGRRIEEVGEILEGAGVISKDAFLAALVKSQYEEPFLAQVSASSLEGFVFPATYEFRRGAPAARDGRYAAARLPDERRQQGAARGAGSDARAGRDAGVDCGARGADAVGALDHRERLLNRLKAGIPLQADPTVQYAVARDAASVRQYTSWKKELTVDDVKIDSPYNTYVVAGLPPGPIANPGLASIEAVVRPAGTNYLFFMSRGDGTHVFAETLEEHLRNVEKYRQQ